MKLKYRDAITEVIASISNPDERKRVAEQVGLLYAEDKSLDWFLWHKECQTEETPIDTYCRIRERVLSHDRKELEKITTVIWVKKEAVRASCNQRATVEGTIIIDERYKKVGVRVNLLGTGEYFNIKLDDIVGVELDETVTLKFKSTDFTIREKLCLN